MMAAGFGAIAGGAPPMAAELLFAIGVVVAALALAFAIRAASMFSEWLFGTDDDDDR